MIPPVINGISHVYGDNVDTDAIIAGKYTKTMDPRVLAEHALEDLDPDFISRIKPGDILVAGSNFGCGSSREQAPLALKTAGISAVIAKYFARIFFRNAINIGLPVVEIQNHSIRSGNRIIIQLDSGIVKDISDAKTYKSLSMPTYMIQILNAGGLAPYLKKHGDYHVLP